MLSVLYDPKTFISRRQESGSVWRPASVVVASSVVSVLGSLALTVRLATALPDSLRAISTFSALVTAIIGLFEPLVMWLGFGVVLHLSSSWISDEPVELRETVRVTAWGFLPYLLGVIVVNAAVAYVAWTLGDPTNLTEVRSFSRSVRTHPLVFGASVLRVLLAVWSGVIWTFAVRQLRQSSLVDAAAAAAGPALGHLITVAWSAGLLPP